MVQDLATQWIQSYPCETKTSQETGRSLRKFLEPSGSLEFGKSCEDLSWNHRSSTLPRSETNGLAKRAVRRIIEGTSAVQGVRLALGTPASPKTRNGPLFCALFSVGMGPFGRSWRSGFFLKSKCEFTKSQRNHPADRPKMHHIVIEECASYQRKMTYRRNAYYSKFRVFSSICGTVVKKKRKGARFRGFWDLLDHLRLRSPEIFGTGMCDRTAGF